MPPEPMEPQLTRAQLRRRFIREVGIGGYLRHFVHRLFHYTPRKIKYRSPDAPRGVWCRPDTSDLDVFQQIFRDREYSCFDNLIAPGLIIDCGANIGFSSVYFLNRFPHAFVVAVEPDAANFAMLEENLAPYGGRFRAVNAALWSRKTNLKFSETPFRDGRAWSIKVEEATSGEAGSVKAVTIAQLLRDSSFASISLLKIDIEGAEVEIFSPEAGYEEWLPKTDNLCIELHDERATQIFEAAVSRENFIISHSGELTVCRRESLPPRS